MLNVGGTITSRIGTVVIFNDFFRILLDSVPILLALAG